MRTEHQNLLDLLQDPKCYPVFVTGAGISIASGIAPFRGTPDAVWEKSVLEKGTVSFFHRDQVGSWLWFLGVFESARGAKPNPGHDALAQIEATLHGSGRKCLTITQNVDGLHTQAGSKNLIECHGTVRHLRCVKRTCLYGPPWGKIDWDEDKIAAFKANPCRATLPRCSCGALLRMHVLWFDESYEGHASYGMDAVEEVMDVMTVLVFIGTSFAVSITDMLTTVAYQRAVPIFVIDPNVTQQVQGLNYIVAPAEGYLPFLAAELPGGAA